MNINIKRFWIVLFLSLAWAPAQAADFKWMDQQGDIHSLAEMKGKPVVLHLWASWCPPCQSELPEFATWLNQHPDVTTIPVSLDNQIDDASAFIAAKQITMPILLSDAAQAGKLGVRGLPTTLIIAADGSISQRHLGPRNWNDPTFNQQLEKALHP